MLSPIRLSIRHTGRSIKNGWSYDHEIFTLHDPGNWEKTGQSNYHEQSDILREIDFSDTINDFAVAKSRKVSGLWI